MAKALKILLAIIFITALLAFIALKLFINEDQIKQQVQDIARQQTNGSLTIKGSLGLSIIPRLSLSLGQLSYQLDGETTAMAELQQLQLGVGLWPLLSGRVEVDEVQLSGLRLRLLRDEQGLGNWEKVAKSTGEAASGQAAVEPAAPADPQAAPEQALSLSVASLSIIDTSVIFEDRSTAASYTLEDFSIQGSNINLEGTAFPLSIEFSLALSDPELSTHIQFSTQASLNLEQQRYRLQQLQLALSLQGDVTANKPLQANISGAADIDLDKEKATLSGLKLAVEGIELSSELSAANWSEQLSLDAQLAIASFNPGKVLPKLGIEAPEFQNPDSFSALSISTDLSYLGNQASLDNIDISLDKTRIQGKLTLLDIEKQKIKTAFAIDRINLDDYLPPEAPATAPAPGTPTANNSKDKPAAADEPLLPIETLSSLDYDARLTLGQLQASGLVFTEVLIRSTANTGLIKLNKFFAKLYQGEIKAHGQVNVRQATPTLSFQQQLSGVNIKPALQALSQIDTVSGKANFNSKLNTRGNTMDGWMRSLNGPVNFNINKLLIKDFNLEQMVCQGIALAHGNTMPDTNVNNTRIETVNGQMQFKNGVLFAKTIKGNMKTLNLKGQGKINPIQEKLNIELGLRVAGNQVNKESACRVNSRYRDVYWPIQCKGKFADEPASLCGIDKDELGKIAADIAKDELKDQAEDKAKDYLKKLWK